MDFKQYEEIAARVRVDIVKAVHKAGSGHPGGSLSAAGRGGQYPGALRGRSLY